MLRSMGSHSEDWTDRTIFVHIHLRSSVVAPVDKHCDRSVRLVGVGWEECGEEIYDQIWRRYDRLVPAQQQW